MQDVQRWSCGLLFLCSVLAAQVPPAQKVAIPIEVQLDRSASGTRAILRWQHDSEYTDSYTVIFRNRATDPQFFVAGTVPPGSGGMFSFELPLVDGTLTEVGVVNRFVRTINNQQVQFAAAGYSCIATDPPAMPFRGRVLLVLDSSIVEPLAAELAQLEDDLDREGWRISRTIVPRAETFNATAVGRTKDSIVAWYRRGSLDEPATVFLIGRVAVPYSGLYYQGQYITPPDGHNPDHRGAWPCDGYYGTISESGWSDAIADTAGVVRQENRNLPGDGKFDNVFFPSPLQLRIGRVDFYNLPRLTPQGSTDRQTEIALLRDYFARDHAYRRGTALYNWSALIDDNFKTYPELFARSGWISFPPIVGRGNVREEKWFPTLDTSSRLFAYGCGAGSYTSAAGIGNINDFATRSVRAAFTMLFGSYFGDWDSQNNLMRVALARGALTCSWSGRPVWFLHPMAAGETIGDIAMMVQNFSPFAGQSVYVSSAAQGWIHVALLGDPTLRVRFDQDVAPPRSLAVRQDGRRIELSWEPPFTPADSIVGYYVYRTLPGGREVALTPEPIAETRFTDSYRVEGAVRYRVRTVGRVRRPSGVSWELSPAAESQIVTTNVEEGPENPRIALEVVPNPASDDVKVALEVSLPTMVRVDIVAFDGRQMGCAFDGYVVDRITTSWDARLLPAGTYFIRMQSAGQVITRPLVIVR